MSWKSRGFLLHFSDALSAQIIDVTRLLNNELGRMWEEGVFKFEALYKPFMEGRKEHHEDHVTIDGFRTKIWART
jgi:hypothetical protein